MIEKFFVNYYYEFCLWLTVVYVAVPVAVALDLVAGLYKSRINGEKMHSRGLKRTCRKLTHYLLPLVAFTLVDTIIAVKFSAPWLTLCYGGFCVMCEACSIMETAADKKALRESMKLLDELPSGRRDDLIAHIKDLINEVLKEKSRRKIKADESD